MPHRQCLPRPATGPPVDPTAKDLKDSGDAVTGDEVFAWSCCSLLLISHLLLECTIQFTLSGACNCNAYLAPAEPLLNVSQESWASRGSEDLSPWERKCTMKGQRWSTKIQLHQHILNCQLYKCAKKRSAYLYMFLHVLFNGFRPVVPDPLAQWDSQLYLWWSAHLCPKWP